MSIIINIVLNIWLISISGVQGAAFATLLSLIIGNWILPAIFKDMRPAFFDILTSLDPRHMFRLIMEITSKLPITQKGMSK